jgi:hypothetical protein
MSFTLPAVESRDVLFSCLKLPQGFNLREEIDLEGKEMEELSASIQSAGLIVPFIVREHATNKAWFDVVSGFRRYAAVQSLGVRGTVPVRICTFDTAADAVLMNIVENTARKSVHTADLACRLWELEKGTYPGVAIDAEGNGALPVERSVICTRTGLTNSYVGNMIRAWGKLVTRLRKEWRRRDIPTDVVIAWAKLKTEEEQIAAFEAWKEDVAIAAAKRAARRAAVEAGEKPSKGDGDGEETVDSEGPKKRKVITSLLAKFQERREAEKLSARDLEIVDAKIATMRWVLGETKRLTFT